MKPSITLFLLISLLWIISCQDEDLTLTKFSTETKNNTKIINTSFTYNDDVLITLRGGKIIKQNGNKNIVENYYYLNSKKIQEFVNDFLYLNINGIPIQVIIFTDESNDNINMYNSNGFCLYYYNDHKLYHKFFKNIDNKFIEKIEYSAESRGIITNATDFIQKNETDFNKLTNFTRLYLINDEIQSLDLYKPFNELMMKIVLLHKKELKQIIRNNKNTKLLQTDIDRNGTTCGGSCDYGDAMQICENPGGPVGYFYCENIGTGGGGDGCSMVYQDSIITDNGYSELAESAYQYNLCYNFRDNFLSKTIFGKWYITYYSGLQYYTEGQISVNLAVNTAYMLIDFNDVM